MIMKKFKFVHSDFSESLSREQLKMILGGGSGSQHSSSVKDCPSVFGGNCSQIGQSCWYKVGDGNKYLGHCNWMPTGIGASMLCWGGSSGRTRCK